MTSEVSPSSDVEKDIGTIECIGRCLGGAFERDLLTHAKLIRAHIASLEVESKRLRAALAWISDAIPYDAENNSVPENCVLAPEKYNLSLLWSAISTAARALAQTDGKAGE